MTKWTKKSIEGAYEGGRRDFAYENFSGLDLDGICLTYANLRETNLIGADMIGANLTGADLTRANLTGADLRWANLRGADLTDADLTGANLRGADLTYANLTDADLTGADLDFSCLPLWCGSLDVRVDKRIAAQLMYHVLNVMLYSEIKIPNTRDELIDFANQMHRTDVKRLE